MSKRRRDRYACDRCGATPGASLSGDRALYVFKGVQLCGRCAYPQAYERQVPESAPSVMDAPDAALSQLSFFDAAQLRLPA